MAEEIHVPCNENQLYALFILSLFRQSSSTGFGHICSPSSGGTLCIYNNWYVFCWKEGCLNEVKESEVKPSEVRQSEVKRSKLKWRESKWREENEVTSSKAKWSGMKFKGEANYSSMKRSKMEWRSITSKCCYLLGKTYTGVCVFRHTSPNRAHVHTPYAMLPHHHIDFLHF